MVKKNAIAAGAPSQNLPAVVIEKQLRLSKSDIIDIAYEEYITSLQNEMKELRDRESHKQIELSKAYKSAILTHVGVHDVILENLSISFRNYHHITWSAEIIGIAGMYRVYLKNMHVNDLVTTSLSEKISELQQIVALEEKVSKQLYKAQESKTKFKHEAIKKILNDSAEGKDILKNVSSLVKSIKLT